MSHHHHHQYHTADQGKKTGWIIAGVFAFFLLIAVGLALSSGASQENKSQSPSKLAASEERYDFGTISMAAGIVTKTFEIENEGGPLVIKRVYTSCMCTNASLVIGDRRLGPFGMQGHGVIPVINQDLAAGEKAVIEVAFDPAAHGPAGVGSIVRNVYVETADGGKLTLEIKARVTP